MDAFRRTPVPRRSTLLPDSPRSAERTRLSAAVRPAEHRIVSRLALRITIVAAVFSTFATPAVRAEDNPSPTPRRRIIYNLDGDSCMVYKRGVYTPTEITADDLRAIVD